MFHFLNSGAPEGMPSAMDPTFLIMMIGMFVVLYFIMIRPEKKRKKEAEMLRSSMKEGDRITTIGGITGVVVDVKEDKFVMETSADQVRIEFAKWAISSNDTAAAAAAIAAKTPKNFKNFFIELTLLITFNFIFYHYITNSYNNLLFFLVLFNKIYDIKIRHIEQIGFASL